MSSNSSSFTPVTTRSTSFTSYKLTSDPKSGPSLDDILIAISGIRSSQDKLMLGHKDLTNNVNLRIDDITSRFDSILSEITELRNKVDM